MAAPGKQEYSALLATESNEIVDAPAVQHTPTWRLAMLTTIPVFMGYAGMICLQGKVKTQMGIKDGGNEDSYLFSTGVSMLYFGNLLFRLLHNVIFSFMRPRHRVVVAYSCMALAHSLIALVFFVADSRSVAFVYVAYLLSGVAIGTFESNLISTLTPLGHGTKSWAVLGIPVGFNLVSVGSFILFAIFPDSVGLELGIYVVIACVNVAGLLFFHFVVPKIDFEASQASISDFVRDIKLWREWAPLIWKHCLALSLDMFCVSLFSSVALFVFDVSHVPLFPYSDTLVPRNGFQAVYNACAFLGDFTSRKIAYRDRSRNPLLFLVLSAVGASLVLSKTALVAPIGMFLVMFANGSIYAQTTKYVDNAVPRSYNLIALSFWLFIGDIGSFIGANVVAPIRTGVGAVDLPRSHAPVPLHNTTTITNTTNTTIATQWVRPPAPQ